jgi:hypothetical protein
MISTGLTDEGGNATAAASSGTFPHSAGTSIVKVEPLPNSLSTLTVPPMRRQKLRVMFSPRPVPP